MRRSAKLNRKRSGGCFEEDKKNLETLLKQIADDEALEKEKKKAAREESIRQMKYVEAQMTAAAESETALDRMFQEEAEKEWGKTRGSLAGGPNEARSDPQRRLRNPKTSSGRNSPPRKAN